MARRRTLQDCHAMAAAKGGKFLSSEYSTGYLEWSCDQGHCWTATFHSIKKGRWCAECAGNKRHTLEGCHELAKTRGFEFLSPAYKNTQSVYQWKCTVGHIFAASHRSILSGFGCKYCSGVYKRDEKFYLDYIAGKSGVVEGKDDKGYIVKCPKGHEFHLKLQAARDGRWCRRCGKTGRKDMAAMHELAATRCFKFVDNEYRGVNTPHLWECGYGHRWMATPHNISTWGCPYCARLASEGEREFYYVISAVFEDAQSKKRHLLPNKRFELDVYVPSLNKAIEYDGDYWHSRPEAVLRDARKEEDCQKAGIKLLRVRDSEYKADPNAIIKYTLDWLRAA